MIVITRHRVPLPEQEQFLVDARNAVALLVACVGCQSANVARAVDDAELMVITTQWLDVGSYRRALSRFDVKVGAVPLLSTAIDEPTAFEVVHRNGPDGPVDADSALGEGATSDFSLGRPGRS